MPAVDTISPIVSVGGPLSPVLRAALIEVGVELALNQPSRCVLRFAATDLDAAAALAKPGTPVEVKLPKETAPLFKGLVVAVEAEREAEGKPTLTIIAYDATIKMAMTSRVQTYLNQAPAAVIKKIAVGLAPMVTVPATPMPYLLQAGTDLEMLDLLAHRTGADWFFDGTNLKFAIFTADGVGKVQVKASELHRLSVRASAQRPDSVEVRGWNSDDQMPVTGKAQIGPPFMSAKPEGNGLVKTVALGAGFTRPFITASVPALAQAEADTLAKSLLRRAASSAVHCEGEGTKLTAMRPAFAVVVKDSGSMNGSYLLTEVRHRWSPNQAMTTSFVAGDRRPAGALDSSGDGAGRSIDTYGGLVVGEVTNIDDIEKRGRVKVRYVGLSTTDESWWARVITVGAGKDRGVVTLPEVGDEVVVGFEGGDLRRPVVLGGVFNKKSKIPLWQVLAGKVAGRRTTSRKGHYIEMSDDLMVGEHILLSLKGDLIQLRLAKDRVELLGKQGNPMKIAAGSQSSIVFDGMGKITITCMDLEIKAMNSIKETALQMESTASSSMKLSSGGPVDVTSAAKAAVVAGGILELKGTAVKIN